MMCSQVLLCLPLLKRVLFKSIETISFTLPKALRWSPYEKWKGIFFGVQKIPKNFLQEITYRETKE